MPVSAMPASVMSQGVCLLVCQPFRMSTYNCWFVSVSLSIYRPPPVPLSACASLPETACLLVCLPFCMLVCVYLPPCLPICCRSDNLSQYVSANLHFVFFVCIFLCARVNLPTCLMVSVILSDLSINRSLCLRLSTCMKESVRLPACSRAALPACLLPAFAPP